MSAERLARGLRGSSEGGASSPADRTASACGKRRRGGEERRREEQEVGRWRRGGREARRWRRGGEAAAAAPHACAYLLRLRPDLSVPLPGSCSASASASPRDTPVSHPTIHATTLAPIARTAAAVLATCTGQSRGCHHGAITVVGGGFSPLRLLPVAAGCDVGFELCSGGLVARLRDAEVGAAAHTSPTSCERTPAWLMPIPCATKPLSSSGIDSDHTQITCGRALTPWTRARAAAALKAGGLAGVQAAALLRCGCCNQLIASQSHAASGAYWLPHL